MLKHLCRIFCALLFVSICIGTMVFLRLFTESPSPYTYPVWEEGTIIRSDGNEQPYDVNTMTPTLSANDVLLLSTTLPEDREDGQYLIFEPGALEITASLDGQEFWHSMNINRENAINLSQVQVPLPAGGGETLEMTVQQLSSEGLIPPLIRLSADPADHAGTIAYANLYGIPAGISALAFVLLTALFLLGIIQDRIDIRLLLPMIGAAALTGNRLSQGYGTYFLPNGLQDLLSRQWILLIVILALLLFLILQRKWDFWLAFGVMVVVSTIGYTAIMLCRQATLSDLIAYINEIIAQIRSGYFGEVFYWLSLWLLLTITFVAGWTLIRYIIQTQKEAYTMQVKNQLALENVHILENKMKSDAAIQHEFRHRLTVLEALLDSGNLVALRERLAEWQTVARQRGQVRYTENWLINAIVVDASNRSAASDTMFKASVSVPKELPFPDEDLCTLLMNMLDNALENTARLEKTIGRSGFSFNARTVLWQYAAKTVLTAKSSAT